MNKNRNEILRCLAIFGTCSIVNTMGSIHSTVREIITPLDKNIYRDYKFKLISSICGVPAVDIDTINIDYWR